MKKHTDKHHKVEHKKAPIKEHAQKHHEHTVEGTITVSFKGIGFVRIEGEEESIEVSANSLNTALHGDRVKVSVHGKGRNGQPQGEVTEILLRARSGFAGTIEKDRDVYYLIPQDQRVYVDLVIPKDDLGEAKEGDKVFVAFIEWTDPKKNPIGKVLRVLGKPGEHDAEMVAIVLESGFDTGFPKEVENESKKLEEKGITEDDLKGRRDFRNTTTFTIDPEDAKDFDDAISIQDLGGGVYEIGVHIADVSHYVRPGTEIDKEAMKRTTSIYLVDRTIPMLPEGLSNGLCSLNANEDKLTFSAVFKIDMQGKISDHWFGRSVIKSNKRFTYENAQETIDSGSGEYYEELVILNKIAKKLKQKRFDEGAISLEQEEVRFKLDETGRPVSIYKKVRGDTHKLVEEFMLLANREVASFVAKKHENEEGVFVYRIHDEPNTERIQNLAIFVKSLGYDLKMTDGKTTSRDINNLLEKLEGTSVKDMIQTAVVRSMAKAIYTTQNIGHFGLGFEFYTHFTSPIRRYPDTMVHRLLARYLNNEKIDAKEWKFYERMSTFSSQREKEASDAERGSIKYKQVEYMSERIGQVFDGVISGVTEWGFYVEEKETKCEGMVPLRTLNDDFYNFEEKRYRLVGEKTKKIYSLGDKIKFKVEKTDLGRKTIDYSLVN
ncbi:MAG: ribonuclease R [Parcubacteria group bacterium LiPW_30]|nr:MAG: ribonuclease R [Parcubacteria group bacterium LiPW_30]